MRWRTLNSYRSALEELRGMPAHELLGVPASATVAEIKAAYRKRVRAYHPDCVDPFLKGHGEEADILRALARFVVERES